MQTIQFSFWVKMIKIQQNPDVNEQKKGLTNAKPFKIIFELYYSNASNASVYAFLGETPT